MNLLFLGGGNLKQFECSSETLGEIWCSIRKTHSRLVEQATEALIPFATTSLLPVIFNPFTHKKMYIN